MIGVYMSGERIGNELQAADQEIDSQFFSNGSAPNHC